MSKRELVDSYVSGRISRRMFVRGLLAVGVTVTAAVTYADQLAVGAPTRRAAQAGLYGDLYPDLYAQPVAQVAPAIKQDPTFTG